MSVTPTDPATDDAAADAERLRTRYPQSRVPRSLKIVLVGIVAAIGLAWLIWAGLVYSQPVVGGKVSAYEVVSDREIAITLTVDRPDPSVPVTCWVKAQATNFEEVGRLEIKLGATEEKLIDVRETIKTFRRATSASLDNCTPE